VKLAIVIVIAMVVPAAAQQPSRGDELIDRMQLQPLRALVAEIAALELSDPLTQPQYAKIIELRQRAPTLARLGAVDEADLAAIAIALCSTPTCTATMSHALRCLADRCEVALPTEERKLSDVLTVPETCKPYAQPGRSAPLGVGLDTGTGYARSSYPADGQATEVGIEARLRLTNRIGSVARIDYISGKDATTDIDDNGKDDMWTGSVTRVAALGGLSFVWGYARFEDEPRFVRLDLLGGYVSTRSQMNEAGPAAGFDLAYQLWIMRMGLRVVQGFDEADHTTMVIGHFGILAGSMPTLKDDGCSKTPSSSKNTSRLALGMDFPLIGYSLPTDLGFAAFGFGLSLQYYLTRKLDAVAQGDLISYPGYERDRTIHQALLAGIRIDHSKETWRGAKTGFFSTAMAGYTHSAGFEDVKTTGPVGDLSLGWGIQSKEAAAYLRLHGRFGISPDNSEYRAIFISGGFELRLDPDRWRPRI